jgi:hypothetical protein
VYSVQCVQQEKLWEGGSTDVLLTGLYKMETMLEGEEVWIFNFAVGHPNVAAEYYADTAYS